MPFLFLLNNFKDMRFQIPNILSTQKGGKKENVSAGASIFVRDLPPRA
jgi:hypothetical protein